MTSSSGNIFRVTDPLCGEFTGRRWIPLTKASDAKLWFFSSIRTWANGGINNQDADDLKRHHAHYDVTAIDWIKPSLKNPYAKQVDYSFIKFSYPHKILLVYWLYSVSVSWNELEVC